MLPKPFVTLISVTALGLSAIATGCGSGAKGGVNADSAAAVDTAAASASAADSASAKPAAEASPDSIPMDITVVVSGAVGGGDGTFHATGNGSQCNFNPNATPRPPDTEWTVYYARMNDSGPKDRGLYSLHMNLGKTANGTTDQMFVTTDAGQITGLGMTVPGHYTIATFKSGAVEGSGTAKVTREGDGVHIEINGTSAGTKDRTKLKITVACKRLSH